MVSIFPNEIASAIKTVLEGSSDLSYVDTVNIRKWRGSNFPDFAHHAIIISPDFAFPEPYDAGGQRWITYGFWLVLAIKMFYGETDIVIGATTTGTIPNVGILKMYEDVYKALYKSTLGGVIPISPGITELDTKSSFSFYEDEATQQFICLAVIPYHPRGERFILPE